MIDKERLEELIEQGATIYEVKYNNINPVSLANKIRDVYYKNGVISFEPRPDEKYLHYKYFKNLFETKEEAEWHREFGRIERTEQLVLPTWEEFEEKKFVWFFDSYHKSCCLHYLNCIDKIFINKSGEVIEIGDFTKENYILACRKAKELFLGEKK